MKFNMRNIKKGTSTALLCVATLSMLSIATSNKGIHASQLNQNQNQKQSTVLSWDNSQPIQKAINNNPQSKLTIKDDNQARVNKPAQNDKAYLQQINSDFLNSNHKANNHLNHVSATAAKKNTAKSNVQQKQNVKQNPRLNKVSNTLPQKNIKVNQRHSKTNHLRKHLRHSNQNVLMIANNDHVSRNHRNHKGVIVRRIHRHRNKKNLPADAVIQAPQNNTQAQQKPVNNASVNGHHSYHYYLKQAWYTDGLNKPELRARHWIVRHESGGHWRILSYGHVCIGYFQLSPSLLRVNGHVSLNKKHQVKAADKYVANRYGDWINAQSWWRSHKWY